MPFETGRTGTADFQAFGSEFAKQSFLVRQILNTVHGSKLVKVMSVTNAGGVAPIGFISVKPLVNQIDGQGSSTPHGTINNLPYARVQGGTNAVILDPVVGDVGIAVFADEDISAALKNGAPSNPGSRRRSDMADGVYLFTVRSGTPTQYVAFTPGGISVTSPTMVTVTAPTIDFEGNVISTGTFINNGVNIGSTHHHADPQGGVVGPPL